MTGDLDISWRGWPASFNFATTIFLVELLVIFFVHTKHWWWILILSPNTEVPNSSWRRVDV